MSENWSSGYVTELDYTYGFYKELAPVHMRFAALAKGFHSHTDATDGLTYCELGCGQGFTANILAAANPEIDIYATDFNPVHAYNAQRLADEAGLSNVHFFDDSFADFEQRTDLPQFNIISLHGIYSWVAKEHRDTIVRFIAKRLKPGGLVYISYNCLPGWAGPSPIQNLIRMHAERGAGSLAERMDGAMAFLEKLQEEGARYFKATARIDDRIKDMKDKEKNYLAHEYLNRDWHAFYQSEVVAELSPARLSYLCTADILHQLDDINFTPSQMAILDQAPDSAFRETVQDYIVNRQFRKDIFARGAIALSTPELREAWLDTGFALSQLGVDIPMKTNGGLGEVALQKDAYWPVIHAIEEAGGHASLRDIVKDKTIARLGWARLQRVLCILVGSGYAHPCPSGAFDIDTRKESASRLNKAILKQALHSDRLKFLASPVTGGGIRVDHLSRIFLHSQQEKERDPVAFSWRILKQQGKNLTKNGEVLKTDEENIRVLAEKHSQFLQKNLPILQRLGIAMSTSGPALERGPIHQSL